MAVVPLPLLQNFAVFDWQNARRGVPLLYLRMIA